MKKQKAAPGAVSYRVLQTIYSRQYNRHFEPGEVITFEPVEDEGRQAAAVDGLVDAGVLEIYVEEPEVTDGEGSANSSEDIA